MMFSSHGIGFRRSDPVLVSKDTLEQVESRFRFLSSITGIPNVSTYVAMHVTSVKENPDMIYVHVVQDCLSQVVGNVVNTALVVKALRGLMTLEAAYGMFKTGGSLSFRVSVSNNDVMIFDWGSGFLFESGEGLLAKDILPTEVSIPAHVSSPKDILAHLYCMHADKLDHPSFGLDYEYVPTRLATGMSKRQIWEWLQLAAPSEELAAQYVTCSYSTVVSSSMWNTHLRIQSCIGTPSGVAHLAKMIRDERISIPPPDRSDVYSYFLGVGELDDCETLFQTKSDLDGYLFAFGRFLGECAFDKRTRLLSQKFKNRVLREDATDLVIRFMQLVDMPLAEHVVKIDGKNVISRLLTSLLCAALSPAQLATLWDALLVEAPELLVRITAFMFVELRELIVECNEKISLMDVVSSSYQLIEDFDAIIQCGIQSSDLVII